MAVLVITISWNDLLKLWEILLSCLRRSHYLLNYNGIKQKQNATIGSYKNNDPQVKISLSDLENVFQLNAF